MENFKKYQSDSNVINEEINYSELIEIGRKLINGDDMKLGLHHINMVLLSPNIDNDSKLNALAIKSYAYFKMNNQDIILSTVKKVKRFLNKVKLETLSKEVLFFSIRILFRAGNLMKDINKKGIALICLLTGKELFELRAMKDERPNLTAFMDSLNPLIESLRSDFKTLKEKYQNKEEALENFKKIKRIFKINQQDEETPNGEISKESDDENYYLISANWVQNLAAFIDKYEKYENMNIKFSDFLDKAFSLSRIAQLILSEDETSQEGVYPGEINNFHILNFKDCWVDPDPQFSDTNTYLKNGLKENQDFFYLSEQNWEFLKNLFNFNFEIKRKTAIISNNRLIEIYPKNVNIF
jgi:hypothetical protein